MSKATKIIDHSKEGFQYDRFNSTDVDSIELSPNGENFEITLKSGMRHIFRGSCALSFRNFNNKAVIIIS